MGVKTDKSTISKKLVVGATISLIIFIMCCIVFGYFLFYRKSEGESVMFPDYVGSLEGDVSSVDKRFQIEKRYVSSDIYPEGVVVSQVPEGLSHRKIKDGEQPTIILNISRGREKNTLPDVVGMSLAHAQIQLNCVECKAKIVRIYEGCEDEDVVIRSFPSQGEQVEIGTSVVLYVSAKKHTPSIQIPDCVGLCVDTAIQKIESCGLAYLIREGYDALQEYGVVIDQTPACGAYVDSDFVVEITVNSN